MAFIIYFPMMARGFMIVLRRPSDMLLLCVINAVPK